MTHIVVRRITFRDKSGPRCDVVTRIFVSTIDEAQPRRIMMVVRIIRLVGSRVADGWDDLGSAEIAV
jgi:hypothetical protein